MRDKITDFIYKPLSWQKGLYKISESHCRFAVWTGERGDTGRQCQHKAVEDVNGYGFCKRHAAQVKEALGQGEQREITWKYAAIYNSYDSAGLTAIPVVKETPKTFVLSTDEQQRIIGNYHVYSPARKSECRVFDTVTESVKWLLVAVTKRAGELERELAKARELEAALAEAYRAKMEVEALE